jgi:hypothetical protein
MPNTFLLASIAGALAVPINDLLNPVALERALQSDLADVLNPVALERAFQTGADQSNGWLSHMDNPIEVFVSYSHLDDRAQKTLETHLSLLRRQGLISVWHDRRITAGSEWKSQIDKHLESAHVILLLVSPNFLDSDYCYEIEMNRALERHDAGTARVVPIIIRPAIWHASPLGRLQALPKDGKAISTWSKRDVAWHDVAQGLVRVIEEVRAQVRGYAGPSGGTQ